ncbi:Nucleotide-diphospho-sugar transferase [Dillenia turbinata]|uniref:Nucleotide-diphospho-sugar transferase n=1 Tax=Dillenia turbinata TaxID=194707 RepID=A0AAN8Z383_9MAGN
MWKIWCGSGTPLGDSEKSSSPSDSGEAQVLVRWCLRIGIICSILTVSCMVLYNTSNPFELLPDSSFFSSLRHQPPADSSPPVKNETKLGKVLRGAAMEDKTVIAITLNEAWAAPNSMFDLFLESLRIGNQTQRLVNHLVVIALDEKAYNRCIASHPHCYFLTTEGIDFSHEARFMTNTYLTMMWRRTNFLRTILEEGYNFVFSDTDIMWFRDPFPRFFPDVDFQIACDQFNGNPLDKNNWPNGGFKFVRSNNKTIEFYRFWNASRITYPGKNEQDILNRIKKDPHLTQIGLEMRFLSTDYFGGFCNPSKDFNLVCTMHANCCFGLDNKMKDLTAMLGDWKRYMALNATQKATQHMSWSVPNYCRRSHPP